MQPPTQERVCRQLVLQTRWRWQTDCLCVLLTSSLSAATASDIWRYLRPHGFSNVTAPHECLCRKKKETARERLCMCVKERGTENVFLFSFFFFFFRKEVKEKIYPHKTRSSIWRVWSVSVDTVSQSTLVIVAVSWSSLVVRVKNRASNNMPALQPADKAVVYWGKQPMRRIPHIPLSKCYTLKDHADVL